MAAFTVLSVVLSTPTGCVDGAGAVCGGLEDAVATTDESGGPTVPDGGRVGTAFAAALTAAGDCTLGPDCTGKGDCATAAVTAFATALPDAVEVAGVLATVDVTFAGFEEPVFAVAVAAAGEVGAAGLLVAADTALGNPTVVLAAVFVFCVGRGGKLFPMLTVTEFGTA